MAETDNEEEVYIARGHNNEYLVGRGRHGSGEKEVHLGTLTETMDFDMAGLLCRHVTLHEWLRERDYLGIQYGRCICRERRVERYGHILDLHLLRREFGGSREKRARLSRILQRNAVYRGHTCRSQVEVETGKTSFQIHGEHRLRVTHVVQTETARVELYRCIIFHRHTLFQPLLFGDVLALQLFQVDLLLSIGQYI